MKTISAAIMLFLESANATPQVIRRGARRIAIVEAPSILGQLPNGVQTAPQALLRAGLASRLHARNAGQVTPVVYDSHIDSATHVLNPQGVAMYATELADAVTKIVDLGEFPLVLGGDCSIMLGGLLALRRKGRYGLLFVDGHVDFYRPEANADGQAAAMELAFATGRGPDLLTRFDGISPLIDDQNIVAMGRRDFDDEEEYRIVHSAIEVIDLKSFKQLGAEASTEKAVRHLTGAHLDGFWVHLDVDVLDDAVMPAVDYRTRGGISFDELSTVLRIALASSKVKGMEITNFNARLDAGGGLARQLVDLLARALSR